MHECLASPAMQDAAGEAHFSVSLAATMEAATCQGDEILKTVLRTPQGIPAHGSEGRSYL